jgi:hypothetical protein
MAVTVVSFTGNGETDYRASFPYGGSVIQRELGSSIGKNWTWLRFCVRAHLSPAAGVTTGASRPANAIGSFFVGVTTEKDASKSIVSGNVCSKHLGHFVLGGTSITHVTALTNIGRGIYGVASAYPTYTDGTSHTYGNYVGTTSYGLQPIIPCAITSETGAFHTGAYFMDLVTSVNGTNRTFEGGGMCAPDYSQRSTTKGVTKDVFNALVVAACYRDIPLSNLALRLQRATGGANYSSAYSVKQGTAVTLDEGVGGFKYVELSWRLSTDITLDVADVAIIKMA